MFNIESRHESEEWVQVSLSETPQPTHLGEVEALIRWTGTRIRGVLESVFE